MAVVEVPSGVDVDAGVASAASAVERPHGVDGPGAAGWVARGAVLLAAAAFVVGFPLTSPDYADLAVQAAIYAMIGLSLNILIGYTGQLSLGHQGFVGIGAFTAAYTLTVKGLPFAATLVVATLVTASAAFLLGVVALRIQGLYLALITLVFGLTMQDSLFQVDALTNGGAGQPAARPALLLEPSRFYLFCLVALAGVVYLDWRLTRTKAGRALRALKENERVAAAFGVNVTGFKLLGFSLTGAIAGLAGALFAYSVQSANGADFDFFLALTFVLMTVVGGLGSRVGVIIGSAFFALITKLLDEVLTKVTFARDLFGTSAQFVPSLIGALLLILTLVFNPGGIAQQLSPLTRWLSGRRFSLHDPDADSGPAAVEGSMTRA